MTQNREALIGAVVLAALVLLFAVNATDSGVEHREDTYRLRAVFPQAAGLTAGAEVRLAGIPIGRVAEQGLGNDYQAHVVMEVRDDFAIPEDSAAVIETDGLLGAKYVEIQPGGAEEMLGDGDRVEYTQGALVLEDLLARILEQARAAQATKASAPAEAAPPQVEEHDAGAAPSLQDSPFGGGVPSLRDLLDQDRQEGAEPAEPQAQPEAAPEDQPAPGDDDDMQKT